MCDISRHNSDPSDVVHIPIARFVQNFDIVHNNFMAAMDSNNPSNEQGPYS
jgi:hypothetical protein